MDKKILELFREILDEMDYKSHCPFCRFDGDVGYCHLFDESRKQTQDRWGTFHDIRLPQCESLKKKLQKLQRVTPIKKEG